MKLIEKFSIIWVLLMILAAGSGLFIVLPILIYFQDGLMQAVLSFGILIFIVLSFIAMANLSR